MNKNILIVEDESQVAQLLEDYLKMSGFQSAWLKRGDRVAPYVQKQAPDLILLDLMLPGMDGIEVCREVRKISNVPIIMVTAKIEEVDRLLGLEMGADDYITKPFSPREVIARVKTVLRRTSPKDEDKQGKSFMVNGIFLDETTHQVKVKEQELQLTPSEFTLLKIMMSHPDRVYSRDDLLNKIQADGFEAYERTIDTHIKNLRKKFTLLLPNREVIKTVYGIGYKFNEVKEE